MKKIFILAFIISIFHLVISVYAFPSINGINVTPSKYLWIGEQPTIIVNCTDNETHIENVSLIIETPTYKTSVELTEGFQGQWYNSIILEEVGVYNLTAKCVNNKGEYAINTTQVFVSELNIDIVSLTDPAYKGETIDIEVKVYKNDTLVPWSIDSNPKFYLFVDSTPLEIKENDVSWNKLTGSWKITINTPSEKVNIWRTLNISVEFESGFSSEIRTFYVSNPFELVSISKKEVKPNEEITLTLNSVKLLTNQNLNLVLGNTPIDPNTIRITSAGNTYFINFPAPNLPPGNYTLRITTSLYSFSLQTNIGYTLPITGRFIDINGKGIYTEIRFLSSGREIRKITTDSSGSYSGEIVPGTYDLEINFPKVTLYLYDVTIDEFNNPINYYSLNKDTEEMKVEGLYVFEVALPYSKTKILINYDESKVPNEKELVVYKCSDWNSALHTCNSKWIKQDAITDTIRNLVTIETQSLSAYALGIRKTLFLDFTSDKTVFGLNELMEIRGIVRDESGNFVPNVLINATVPSTNIKLSTYSDSSGIFSFQFVTPQEEGFYFLDVRAEKDPYIPANKTWNFQVIKERAISIVVPDGVRIKKGEKKTISFSVINTGQADIYNLSFYLKGLPENYFSMQESVEKIKVGEEIKVPITFEIPLNASENTYSLTFGVTSGEINKEEIVGLTIYEENVTTQPQQQPSGFSFPTANIVLPFSLEEITYLSIFAVVSISTAYFLKKRKKRKVKGREEIKNLLFDIKREIQRKKIENPMQAFNELIEKEKKD